MINLNYFILISFSFLSGILFINNNYTIICIPAELENFKHIAYLEENQFMIPFVLESYYKNVINIIVNLFPYSLLSSSFWHNNGENEKDNLKKKNIDLISSYCKKSSLVYAITIYILVLWISIEFDPTVLDYQLLTNIDWGEKFSNLILALGIDALSLPFLLLIGFIFPIVFLSSWSNIKHNKIYYYIIIILLEIFLLIVFLVIDMIMFYVFFESILPLLFVLVGFFGAIQRFRAGTYLFLYTLLASVFMLLAFVKMGADLGNTYFSNNNVSSTVPAYEEEVGSSLSGSLSVKTPLAPGHIWLPLAHGDADISGSIILAAIVLKLSMYGFLRLIIGNLFVSTNKIIPYLYALICSSIVYASSTTIRQFDFKVMVAYSSIAHMASSLLGTFSNHLAGIIGSIIFGLAHGLVSPALFFLVGAVLYDRCGSRIINYYKGLTNNTPFFAFIFLLFMFANMGVPLTGNFIGEFLSLIGAYQQNIFITSIGALSIILSAVYSIYAYNRITSGSQSPFIFTIPDLYRKEYYILLPLLIFTIILGIFPSFITSEIEYGLSQYLLFSFSPVVLLQNDRIHELNCNPHNTPVVPPVLPPSTNSNGNSSNRRETSSNTNGNSSNNTNGNSSNNTNGNSSNQTETSNIINGNSSNQTETSSNINANSSNRIEGVANLNGNSSTRTQEGTRNQSNTLNIGNRDSDEGITPYVPLDDRRNQPVDAHDLAHRLTYMYPRADPTLPRCMRPAPGNESENLFSDLERNRNNVDSDLNVNSDSSSESSSDSDFESSNNLRARVLPTNSIDNIESDNESESNFADDELEDDNNENNTSNSDKTQDNQKDSSDSDQDKNSESTHAEGSGSRNNDESTNVEDSNLDNNNESGNIDDSNPGDKNEPTNTEESNSGNSNEPKNIEDSNLDNNESSNVNDSNSDNNNNESGNVENSNSDNNNEKSTNVEESNSGNNEKSTNVEESDSGYDDESTNIEDSNSRNNDEEEIESKDKENTADNKESSISDKSKEKELEKMETGWDSDDQFSASSASTIDAEEYHERNTRRDTSYPTQSSKIDSDSDSDNNKGQNNYSIENGNNKTLDTYTFSGNNSLNNLFDGYSFYIPDYIFNILNFIDNHLTFDISNITPMHIILLSFTFISYYRYYILSISYKYSFDHCFIILRFWISEFFSYFNKKNNIK